jgi:peptidoglycan hydrolase-like protein with peptidoglycan-binding domain
MFHHLAMEEAMTEQTPTTPEPPDGIVPPYLDARWRRLRRHLSGAASAALEATATVNTDDAKKLIGTALTALMDASFMCGIIERDLCNDPLAGVEDAPDTDSA